MKRRTFLKQSAALGLIAAFGNTVSAQPKPRDPMKILLWCWDSRMTWDDEPDKIQLKMAAAERHFPYPKRPESYQQGFRRLVDYCADTGIWGVIIWGFLRDSHGGVEAAKDLCKYASDKGVAILPGVGLCSYGGYFYEGDHPFNLDTYLNKHPDRASDAYEDHSKVVVKPVLDPSLEANQLWWREGLDWMMDTFEIAGINYEMGDFIVNTSDSAKAARKALNIEAHDNVLDMIVATSDLLKHAQVQRPDATYINALYRGYHQLKGFPKLDYLDSVPDDVVWEYTLTNLVKRNDFPDAYWDVPAHRQYGYLHWFNVSTKSQEKDITEEVKQLYPHLRRLGFEFVGTYGEIGVQGSAVADMNYRIQVDCAKGVN
jgi:hypothetical protein